MQQDYTQKVTDFFDRRTDYDNEGRGHPENARRLLDFVEIREGQAILDLATGTGLIAIPVAEKVGHSGSVIGVDFSRGMLAQAQAKIAAEGINNLELVAADIESVEFNSERFDLIFCSSALVYISDLTALLGKCYRWLKPEGCLAFTSPKKGSHLSQVRVEVCQKALGIDFPHIIRPLWTSEKCRQLLRDANFKQIDIEEHLFRRDKINDGYNTTQIETEFYPRGNPLANLTPKQKQLLQAAYTKAIDRLIAEEGRWQDAINLYVRAYKQAGLS